MSEMKAIQGVINGQQFELYFKPEADKVIAEKDSEIARLNAIRKVHVEAIESMGAGLLQDDKEIRHQKYKRCLAMAKWCRLHDEFTQSESERLGLPQRAIFMEYRRKAMWWNKWHRRWLEIAENFKEARRDGDCITPPAP